MAYLKCNALMKRTSRNATRSRIEIIEKSAPIFNVHGYSGTSMQMLVDATGFQMGGIYRHFSSKKELAEAAFLYNYQVLIKQNLLVDENLSPPLQLMAIVDQYQSAVLQPKVPGGCPIINTATEMDDTDPTFSELTKKATKEVLSIVQNIIELGQKDGSINETLDAKSEAIFFFASIEGAVILSKTTQSARPLFTIFDKIKTHVQESLAI